MVFKNPLNLARSGIAKTFAHYPQQLVAATQSGSQSHPFSALNNALFKPPQPHQPLHNASSSNSSAAQPQHPTAGIKSSLPDSHGSEGGLAAYYAAWAKHQNKKDEKEWHQFQFAKRIGWKAPTTILESQLRSAEALHGSRQRSTTRASVQRSHTASAVDDIKAGRQDPLAVSVPAGEDVLLSDVGAGSAQTELVTTPSLENQAPLLRSATTTTGHDSPAATGSFISTVSTDATSVSEVDAYTDHLTSLAEAQRYAEIPAVFESMLRDGVKPSVSAYNALLLAAINLPRGRHQVVPKALDVYADMVRRRVLPDTSTYAILIELLAARSLDVSAMKTDLASKRQRHEQGRFLLRSDETEAKILEEDDSLSLAVKLFDLSAAVSTDHVFTPETYRLLITSCAQAGRVEAMVRVYANMETAQVTPPSAIFPPMIQAFAATGDLRSAVECYDEYKALAIAHDQGQKTISRRDADVYAALVKAYLACDRYTGGLKFLGKVEDTVKDEAQLKSIRDAVALNALYPTWLASNQHREVLQHATEKLSGHTLNHALVMVCVDAADKNMRDVARTAFDTLQATSHQRSNAVVAAMVSMFIRQADVEAAISIFRSLDGTSPWTPELIEPATALAIASVSTAAAAVGLSQATQVFRRVRASTDAGADVVDRIEESLEAIIGQLIVKLGVVQPAVAVEALRMMIENKTLITALAEPLMAGIGPQEVTQLDTSDSGLLLQVQASVLNAALEIDAAHVARLCHLLDIAFANGSTIDSAFASLLEQTVAKVNQPGLTARWNQRHMVTAPASPVSAFPTFASPIVSSTVDSTWDPHGASTDFRGSSIIAEELEKSHGKSIVHLNDALAKFRNIRRAGRHPRYITYAKLIAAAARENRLNLAQEILAMARTDVPYVANSTVVQHGWATILDSMVAACLTVGDRQSADLFHHELRTIGAAPSANTFGLYITTLKESTKTFDEATEAVKIFHQAKAEGVEPSSFLYNALIGKLGKARRIDDCLFYFTEMRNLGIRPTSVTYGTIVNALCRVSDDKFAEELFEEMESMPNYKPRPAPYNSLMQYFLTTKRDRSKVLAYYERMKSRNIKPTMHTYKLLIDSYATLQPIDMPAAEALIGEIPQVLRTQPEAVHYASLIHAKGCVLRDTSGAREMFDKIISENRVAPQPCLYQALFESMVANHDVTDTEPLVEQMREKNVQMTPYIANSLIHGWATAGDIQKSKQIFESLGKDKREPSTYEAMTRAWLAAGEHGQAMRVVGEMLKRGYPSAVAGKITELVSPHATA